MAQNAIEHFLRQGQQILRAKARRFLRWLYTADAQHADASELQRRYTVLRMQFNISLAQFDIFADVIPSAANIRQVYGWLDWMLWLLMLLPFLVISTLRLRLSAILTVGTERQSAELAPGFRGEVKNPVAIIRVPRERMVGSGIASSLVHEVGHQGAALLDLSNSLRPVLHGFTAGPGKLNSVWLIWDAG